MDNVDNFQKSYPHKKPNKIKGYEKLSTMKNELSTSYQQLIHSQKIKKVIHIRSYPHFVDNFKIRAKKLNQCG